MASLEQLSLQSLSEQINNKADKNHTHTFKGSIDSALSLRGVPADSFVRNDINSQTIQSYGDLTNLSIASNNTKISIKAKDNTASLEVDSPALLMSSLNLSGAHNTDISLNVQGQVLINNSRVLTLNEANEVTGVDITALNVSGKGILVDSQQPMETEDGTIWGQVIEEDVVVDEDTAQANNNLYTVPIGTIIRTLSNTIPNGYIKADGRLVSRKVYSPLWRFVKTQSLLMSDTDWSKALTADGKVCSYSYGDGVTNFRMPKLLTEDNTIYLIKAYDELNVKETVNLSEINEIIQTLASNTISSGIGFIKYSDGALIQYGTVYNATQCNFSISFIDNNYSVITNYEGTLSTINNVSILNKNINKCTFAVYGNSGVVADATVNYIAIGRWK